MADSPLKYGYSDPLVLENRAPAAAINIRTRMILIAYSGNFISVFEGLACRFVNRRHQYPVGAGMNLPVMPNIFFRWRASAFSPTVSVA